jgi:hypothetical protein
MWHAIQGDGEHVLIATPWRDDVEKAITIDQLRKYFRERQVKRFAFIVEAWTARQVQTLREVNEGPRPSEHPDRREVLMISAEDRDGSQIMGQYYILRPEHGRPSSPLQVNIYDKTTGRMTGLLD